MAGVVSIRFRNKPLANGLEQTHRMSNPGVSEIANSMTKNPKKVNLKKISNSTICLGLSFFCPGYSMENLEHSSCHLAFSKERFGTL